MVVPERRHSRRGGLPLPLSPGNILSFFLGAICSIYVGWMPPLRDDEPVIIQVPASSSSYPAPAITSVPARGGAPVGGAGSQAAPADRDFYPVALATGTDKVLGEKNLPKCIKPGTDDGICSHPDAANPKCRPFGHFYHTVYDRWLRKYSGYGASPIQFLEIGFFNGRGFDAFMQFLPAAETHSMEISCIPPGSREEGKWPWGNFAEANEKLYRPLLDQKRLHCGDASELSFLDKIWREEMNRPDAPPLKVVIDDGSHIAMHMVQTVFFWFPRIEPGGVLVVEDIQATGQANPFRTQFLPQVMADLHYCGVQGDTDDTGGSGGPCFPTLQPLLQSIHCELHICVFERNEMAAVDIPLEDAKVPPNALDKSQCSILK